MRNEQYGIPDNRVDCGRIEIYAKSPSIRNDYSIMVAYIGNREDLGTWSRTLKHRGVNDKVLASRKMTSEEIENEKRAWRLHWDQYQSWEKLIADEWRVTGDLAWCEKLWDLAKISKPLQGIIDETNAMDGVHEVPKPVQLLIFD